MRQYFIYLEQEKQVSVSTFQVALNGIKFLYRQTLQREWPLLSFIKPRREKKLPVVLSRAEVKQVLGFVQRLRYRVCLSTIYSCGLRLQEGVRLQVGDIDSGRMMVHVRQGKGRKDRYVPLAPQTLAMLRQYWGGHRHRQWLFPSPTAEPLSQATKPMDHSGVQRAFGRRVTDSGLQKPATGPYIKALLCDPSAGGGGWAAVDPSLSRAQFAQDDRHLYPPDGERPRARSGSDQSVGRRSGVVELADIFREYGPAYRAKYRDRMLPSHLRAMWGHRALSHPGLGRSTLRL